MEEEEEGMMMRWWITDSTHVLTVWLVVLASIGHTDICQSCLKELLSQPLHMLRISALFPGGCLCTAPLTQLELLNSRSNLTSD